VSRASARRRAAAAAVLVAALLSACTGGHPKTLPAAPATRPLAYVALGGGDTFGTGAQVRLRNAWPYVFFRTALPRSATLVNLAATDATVDDLLDRQVPEALQLHPDLVTISITDDAFTTTPGSTVAARLQEAVQRLRAGGTRVLVANIPPLDRRPGYTACLPGADNPSDCQVSSPVPTPAQLDARVAALNQAIAKLTAAEGAALVDLSTPMLAERAAGREADEFFSDDLSPNATGSAVYARAFATAYAQAR
jgi:lysophospholipase L1-like esterase